MTKEKSNADDGYALLVDDLFVSLSCFHALEPVLTCFLPSIRRAKAERLSAIRAMQARQRKGILSEADELKLAEEMSKMARVSKSKSGDSDCIIQ